MRGFIFDKNLWLTCLVVTMMQLCSAPVGPIAELEDLPPWPEVEKAKPCNGMICPWLTPQDRKAWRAAKVSTWVKVSEESFNAVESFYTTTRQGNWELDPRHPDGYGIGNNTNITYQDIMGTFKGGFRPVGFAIWSNSTVEGVQIKYGPTNWDQSNYYGAPLEAFSGPVDYYLYKGDPVVVGPEGAWRFSIYIPEGQNWIYDRSYYEHFYYCSGDCTYLDKMFGSGGRVFMFAIDPTHYE